MNKAMSIPAGYRFYPRDHELIEYLVSKITDKRLPCNGVVLEADLFGETPPWEVFANAVGNEPVRYFFTKLKQKNGKHFKRTVGDIGTWRGDTCVVKIMHPKNRSVVIGEKKSLSFRINNNMKKDIVDDCKWLMTEYSLGGVMLKYKRSRSDYVLCQIKKKKILQKQVLEEVEEDSDMDDGAAVGVGHGETASTRIPDPPGVNNIYPQSDSSNPVSEEYYCNNNNYYNQLQNPHQGLSIAEYDSSAQAVGEEYNNKVGLQTTSTDLLLEDEDESAQVSGGELEFYLEESHELWVRHRGVGDEGDNYHNNLDHDHQFPQGFEGEAAVGVEGNNLKTALEGSNLPECDSSAPAVGVEGNINSNNLDDKLEEEGEGFADIFGGNRLSTTEWRTNVVECSNVNVQASERFSSDDTFTVLDPLWN